MIDENKVTKVLIVTVWLKGLRGVYDAYSIARVLRFRELGPFVNEVRIHGGISVDDYGILAMFHGTEKLEGVKVLVDRMTIVAEIPGGFILKSRTNWGHNSVSPWPDATDRLGEEMYVRNGTVDEAKFISLALSMGSLAYTSETSNNITEITCPFGGTRWIVTSTVVA